MERDVSHLNSKIMIIMLKFYGIVILCDSVFLNNDSSTTLKRRPDEGQVFFFLLATTGADLFVNVDLIRVSHDIMF